VREETKQASGHAGAVEVVDEEDVRFVHVEDLTTQQLHTGKFLNVAGAKGHFILD